MIPQARDWTFHQLAIGDSFSIERVFTVEDVQNFARLSGDFSPLHVDPDYARTTEFGSCVVHGVLLASLFSQLVGMHIPGKHALYLGQDLAFRKPVLVGERVKAFAKVAGKNEATRSLLLTTEIRNAEDKTVVSGSAKVKVRDGEVATLPITQQAVSPAGPSGRMVALVTGASGGIGAEIAHTLASRGAAIAVNYFQNSARANTLVDSIRKSGGEAIVTQGDVRNPEDVERILATVRGQFGRLDWLVNAAIGGLSTRPFVERQWSDFQEQLDYQLKAVVQMCQAVYRGMKAAGGGAIVNILSQVTADQPPSGMADYVSAKYALLGLSKALAVEWATDQIRVNMISPGLTETDLTQHYHDRIFKMEASRTPLKRIAQPVDIANSVAFLLSKEAAFLTGVNLFVTGGQVMV
jgi:NAD(P)-dependent dehydrogenase (short-subunit alcohol dehydrogenase family)/acyl dehydratase